MAYPEMSPKVRLNSDAPEQYSTLPIHYVDSTSVSRSSFVKPGLIKGLIVGLAGFAAFCFSLHLFFGKHPAYLNLLQTYPDSSVAAFDAKHISDKYNGLNEYHTCDKVLPIQNSTLARRQAGNNKQWFFIPVSSNRYRFTSRGSIDRSVFRVVPFASSRQHIVVKVEITKDPRQSARVSPLPGSGGETDGVEISSEDNGNYGWFNRDRPAFNVIVYIPIPGRQLRLNSFQTKLSQFEHIFPDLSRYVVFSQLQTSATNVPMTFGSQLAASVDIRNLNSPISMNSIVANTIHVTNANAAITGSLTGVTELVVSNKNAKIDGEYTLTQGGSIKITNANSATSARLRLQSRYSESLPTYRVEVSNANAPVDLKVLEQPVGSRFFLKGSSSWSSLRVRLNAAFEGRFRAKTSFSRPNVQVNNRGQDPSGRGRNRVVTFDERGSTTSGRASWGSSDGDENHAAGDVVLNNSGGSTELFFD